MDEIEFRAELWRIGQRMSELNAAYRERNAVVAALLRVGDYEAFLAPAPDADGWWIVYAGTPAGQVSWHIGPTDLDLFPGLPRVDLADAWDGHDTAEKYRRVGALGRPPLDVRSVVKP